MVKRWRQACFRLAHVLASCLFLSGALAISYTVQVVALSDQDAALELRQHLSTLGFPVYMVSVPTQNGVVSRIRIGAFANRAAAVSFARIFDEVSGSLPAPALAEGIPGGLIPLEPELVASYPYIPGTTRLEVIPWGDAMALRFQGTFEGEPLEADYRVLTSELEGRPFSAWRAAPAAEGDIVRVYGFALWPGPEGGETAALETYQENLLATVAAGLDVGVETLRHHLFYTPGAGMPQLVLAERFDPHSGANSRFRALGLPSPGDTSWYGPKLQWLGSEPEDFPSGAREELFSPSSVLGKDPDRPAGLGADWQISGDGWTARPDGAYTRLAKGAGAGWRALAGFPIWGHGDYLLVYARGEITLYRLHGRAR